MERLSGWAELGNQTVNVAGQNSSNSTPVQRSFPNCNVSVYPTGNNNLATIYSDNNGTPLANPFTASNVGYWFFYAPNGEYDVTFSGSQNGLPVTLAALPVGSIQSLNGQNGDTQNFAVGASGNNFNIVSANDNHTFNLPQANANNNGYLAASDWSSFNNKSANLNFATGNTGNNFNITGNNNNYVFNLPQANANNNGYLGSSDWANFNSKSANLNFAAPLANNNNNVSITLPLTVAQGGTNSTNSTAAFDALSPANTLGDIITADNNGVNVRVPVGANNFVLTADGSNATFGFKWAPPSANNFNGVLPIANGGTGQNNNADAFNALAPTTTAGDLIVYGNGTNTRIGVGSNGQVLQANSSNNNGLIWGPIGLNTNSVSGVLPIGNGGTGANNKASGFAALAPITSLGDLIVGTGNNNSARLPAGSNGQVLSANNANATGFVYVSPTPLITKYTIQFNNNAFIVAAASVDITLFGMGQFQKSFAFTVKHSAIFTNNNNSITDVGIAIQQSGNANFYTANFSIGNATPVSNTAFQDTQAYKSGNMGGAQAVVAHFVATGGNFGNGLNTNLVSGSVDIWVSTLQLQ